MADSRHITEALQVKPIDLAQSFINTRHRNLARSTIGDFWQWAYSDIANNASRGVLAEYIVAKALGSKEKVRANWAAYDVDSRRGVKVEVKSAAFLQSWPQEKRSSPGFDIAKARGWDFETGECTEEPRRHADVYVFSLLAYEENKLLLNPLDLNQWEFYVVATSRLNQNFDNCQSLGLTRVREVSQPYRAEELASAVAAVLGQKLGKASRE